MKLQDVDPDLAILDTADRIARATHLWLRQPAVLHGTACSVNGSLGDEPRMQWLVAGLISELCEHLQLTAQHAALAAYAYALLDGSGSDSLEIAAILSDTRSRPHTSMVFAQGCSLACEMLALLEGPGLAAAGEDESGWHAVEFTGRHN